MAGVRIGAEALIGAGAVVTHDVAAGKRSQESQPGPFAAVRAPDLDHTNV